MRVTTAQTFKLPCGRSGVCFPQVVDDNPAGPSRVVPFTVQMAANDGAGGLVLESAVNGPIKVVMVIPPQKILSPHVSG